jgi:hypothetical protein
LGGNDQFATCQTAAMADLTIFIVLLGDLPVSRSSFSVTATASFFVAELKKLVYAEKRKFLGATYAAADLIV